MVQVAAQDLLVAELEVVEYPRLDPHLGRFQRVGVLQGELLERHRRHLLGDALTGVRGGMKYTVPSNTWVLCDVGQ